MEKDLALAGVAHDLNNVLQTVAHVGDLLSTDRQWSTEAELLIRCVDRGRAILDSLREEASTVDLRAVCQQAAQGAEPLRVQLEIAPDLRFPGKPLALERALLNLLWNSARAGARCVAIRAEHNGQSIEIEVSDDGPGIPEHDLAKVFEPGFSTAASTGLGLRIVEAIVQDHGGAISASNRNGACFQIRIPAA
jgi:signal transduction histidine kinase